MKLFHSFAAFLLLVFPVLAQPPTNKNAYIELPPDQEIPLAQRSLKITAKTEGAEIQWIVISGVTGLKAQWDDVGNKSIRIYPDAVEDVILVFAYTTTGMPPKATPPAVTTVLVVAQIAPKEGQQPAGAAAPAPKKSGLVAGHVSFVIDSRKQTPEVAAIINDQGLRKMIGDAGIKLHPNVDVASSAVTNPKGGLGPEVIRAGGAPCIIIQDAKGNVIDYGRLTTIQAVRDLIATHTK